MLKKISEKKGSISILFVITCLIAITIIGGLLDINKSNFILNEIQSVMDLSTTSGLMNSINTERLREEQLAVGDSYVDNDGNKNVHQAGVTRTVRGEFDKALAKNLKTGTSVQSYKIVKFGTELTYDSWGTSYGNKAIKRPQLILDSVIQVTIKTDKNFDSQSSHVLKDYNARNGSNDISINVSGVDGDGNVILTVRCLGRIVYR